MNNETAEEWVLQQIIIKQINHLFTETEINREERAYRKVKMSYLDNNAGKSMIMVAAFGALALF